MSRTISTNYLNGLTLTDTADSPVYLAPGVTIANGSGIALYAVPANWSVTNGISAQVNGYEFGVALPGAGTLSNLGTITSSYTVGRGYSYSTATQQLTITSAAAFVGGGGISNGQTGTISGGLIGAVLGGNGSIVNAGVVSNTVAGVGFGVGLTNGGNVTNLTGGAISGGHYGVLTDGPAAVYNQFGGSMKGGVRGIFMINGAGSVTNAAGGTVVGGYFAIQVNGAASVTNQGFLNGTTVAAVRLSGGSVTNLAGGTLSGGDAGILDTTNAASVTNLGLIQQVTPFTTQNYAIGGVLLLAGGSVNNSGGTISGASYGVDVAGVAGAVTNSGLIAATRTGGGAGIELVAGGTVQNSGRITSHDYGVLIANAAGTVSNTGTIASYANGLGAGVALRFGGLVTNAGGATITSGAFGVRVVVAAGTVLNAGYIASSQTFAGAGVDLVAGGSVTNSAGGTIASPWIGVQFGAVGTSTAGTFVNQGSVFAGDTKGDGAAVWVHGPGVVINDTTGLIDAAPFNGVAAGGFGIVTYYQTTIVNRGVIGGKTAVAAVNAGVGNLVELAPGATFGGVVQGAKSSADAHLATLELLSGASVGTIGGFGPKYQNFGNVVIDPDAHWNLGGTVAPATTIAFAGAGNASLTLINPTLVQGTITGFAPGDTIGLTGVTITGSSFAGGVLTLNETSSAIALNLPGNFATNEFTVTNVPGVGAQVNVALSRTLSWTGATGTAFDTAANWNDLTNSQNPALTAPGAPDTILINTSGGAISGTGTVATIDVGSAGTGVLQLSAGATLVADSLDAGVVAGSVGQIGVVGVGTELSITGAAVVADDGTGVLSVLGGATFAAGSLTIGSQGNSSGALVVSGSGSVVNLTGALNIGTALGTGDLTVGPGAAVHASVVNLQGQVVLEGGLLDPTVNLINQGQTAGGFGTLAAGDIIDEGVIQAGGTKPTQRLLLVQGTVVGGGTLTKNGTVLPSSPAGLLQINAGGTMELTGSVLNAATTTFQDALTPTGTYTITNSVIDVSFADAAGVLLLDDIAGFGGTITTFKAGDQFVITGGTLSAPSVSNGNTLTFSDSGVNAGAGGIDRIIFGSPVNAGQFNIVNGNTMQAVACFAAGTRIETDVGPVTVEALRVGDRVKNHRGEAKEIVWIGQRDVDCRHHPRPEAVCPVRVLAGAFRPGMPSRDLWLSPDHAVFVDGVLIPIHCLINGGTIRQVTVVSVSYHHIELSEHDVIRAEGLAVESYLDTGQRANFANGGAPMRLYPDFSARMWEMAGCAPLVMTGPVLQRVREALARRAAIVSVPLGVRPARINNRYTYY